MPKKITCTGPDGVQYHSQAEMANAFGVSRDAVYRSIKKNGRYIHKNIAVRRGRQITHNGVTYRSINDAGTALKIGPNKIARNIDENGEYTGPASQPKNRRAITCNGLTYPSIISLSHRLISSCPKIRSHLKKYGTVDHLEAGSPPPDIGTVTGCPVIHNGVTYPTISAAAKSIGCHPTTISYHLDKYGHTDFVKRGKIYRPKKPAPMPALPPPPPPELTTDWQERLRDLMIASIAKKPR